MLRFGFGPAAALLPLVLHFGDELLRLPHLDDAALDQPLEHLVEDLFRRARRRDDAARVQRHVALLDAFGRERADRREVLRETHGGHDLPELGRGLDAEQAQIQRHGRVRLDRRTDDAHLDRQLDAAAEIAGLVGPPVRQRRIAAAARRVSVRAGLDGAPVVARRDGDGIDAVHDAFVVRGGAIRIDGRELGGDDDAVARLLAACSRLPASCSTGILQLRAHERAVGEVRQDAQEHLAARDRLDERRDALAHAVDEIRAHRVARVDEQVHDEHLLGARRQRMDEQLDVAGAAAARHHVRVQAVGEVDDLLLALAQRLLRLLHVGQIHDLNLADQNRVRRFGLETAARADQLACGAHAPRSTDGSSTTIGTMYC